MDCEQVVRTVRTCACTVRENRITSSPTRSLNLKQATRAALWRSIVEISTELIRSYSLVYCKYEYSAGRFTDFKKVTPGKSRMRRKNRALNTQNKTLEKIG